MRMEKWADIKDVRDSENQFEDPQLDDGRV